MWRTPSGPIDGYALVQTQSGPPGMFIERVVAQSVVKTPPLVLDAGRYLHLVGVYDGAELQLYVTGELVASQPDPRPLAPLVVPPLIGAQANSAFLEGDLDEVALYDHPLSAERIALHHAIGTMP